MRKKLLSLMTLLLCAVTGAWADGTSTLPTSGSYSNGTTKYDMANSGAIVADSKIYWAARNSVTVGDVGLRPYATAFALQVTAPAIITFNVKSSTTTARTITGQTYTATEPYFNVWKNTTVSTQTLENYVIAVNAKEEGERTTEEAAIAAVSSLAAITSNKDSYKKMLICEAADASIATASGTAISHSCPTTKGGTNSFEVSLPAAGKYVIYLTSSGSGVGITSIDVTAAPTYTVTYKANGGTGSDVVDDAAATVAGCPGSFTAPAGKVFAGWNTAADGTGTDYAVGTKLTADLTLYAQWAENFCVLIPATSGDAPSSGDEITMQSGSSGATMTAGSANLSYTSYGLQFGTTSGVKVSVALDYKMVAGSVINLTLYAGGDGARGLYIYDSEGNKVATVGFSDATKGDEETFSYTVKADDGLEGKSVFQLWRNNTVCLEKLTVAICETVTITPSKEYTTLTSANGLDFTNVDGLKPYVVTADIEGGKVTLSQRNKMPADEGMVLKAETPGTGYKVPVFVGTADDVTGNKMEGSASATTAIAENGGYILSNGKFHPASAGDLPAGKAYLAIEVTAPGIVDINFNDDNSDITTGIDTIEHSPLNIEHSEVYNLNGQRVSQPTKGLYIVNGRKVIVK